jgi:hypothetical protein
MEHKNDEDNYFDEESRPRLCLAFPKQHVGQTKLQGLLLR